MGYVHDHVELRFYLYRTNNVAKYKAQQDGDMASKQISLLVHTIHIQIPSVSPITILHIPLLLTPIIIQNCLIFTLQGICLHSFDETESN